MNSFDDCKERKCICFLPEGLEYSVLVDRAQDILSEQSERLSGSLLYLYTLRTRQICGDDVVVVVDVVLDETLVGALVAATTTVAGGAVVGTLVAGGAVVGALVAGGAVVGALVAGASVAGAAVVGVSVAGDRAAPTASG